ncbi:MAG: YicC family protein [Candidatus Babeliales bacterium]|nr:YicC family protein [Candidatus Babeliales bacterium]
MIYSMTGFASKLTDIHLNNGQQDNIIKLSLSLKSLNSRFFDINCKLPYALNQFETEIIKLIKSKLLRGNINFSIYLNNPNAFKSSIEASTQTVSGYINALNNIKNEFNISGDLSISDILKLPDIFIAGERIIDEQIKIKLFETINLLIDNVIIERKKEGDELQRDLELRMNFMDQKIHEIEKIFESTLEEQKQKVSKKIHELNEANENFTEVQRQNLYNTLDKMDITEEVVRFKSHLKNIRGFLTSRVEEKGRQIDFTLQELAREINTITAKTPSAQISELAISVKVELEKAREQTQNIV